jgi:hypothetical protein
MPTRVRQAMLHGIDHNEIIVGAYVDNFTGGICPMLAAHRNGGRINLGSFARAWDAFTGATGGKPRPATERELGVLRSYLEMSLASDGIEVGSGSLAAEVREVKASRRRLAEVEARESPSLTIEEILSDALSEEELLQEQALGEDAPGAPAPLQDPPPATEIPRREPLPVD